MHSNRALSFRIQRLDRWSGRFIGAGFRNDAELDALWGAILCCGRLMGIQFPLANDIRVLGMGSGPPVGQALIRCWRLQFQIGEGPLFSEYHRHQQPARRTCDVAFPRNVFVNGQHPPDHTAVEKRDEQRHPRQQLGLPDHARREEEGRQCVIDAACTDVVAAFGKYPQADPREQVKQNPCAPQWTGRNRTAGR